MRRWLIAGFVAAAVGTFVAAPPQLPRNFAQVNAVAALNAYEAGEFDLAVEYLQRVVDWVGGICNSDADAELFRGFEVFANRFGQHAGTWILAVPEAERPRRRQIAAVVALEVGHVAPRFWGNRRACASWAEARVVVEWACQMLRSAGPPTSFERLWHLAAMALIERAQDTVFMSGGPPPAQRERDHAAHAIEGDERVVGDDRRRP